MAEQRTSYWLVANILLGNLVREIVNFPGERDHFFLFFKGGFGIAFLLDKRSKAHITENIYPLEQI